MSERIPEVVCERININESEVLVFSVKNGLSKIGICRINSEYDKYCLYSHDEPVMAISGGMNDDDADKVISASGGSIIADSIDRAYEKLAAGGSPEYALEPLMRLLSDGLYAVSYVETYPTAGENMFFWSGYGVSKQLRNSSRNIRLIGDKAYSAPFLIPTEKPSSYDPSLIKKASSCGESICFSHRNLYSSRVLSSLATSRRISGESRRGAAGAILLPVISLHNSIISSNNTCMPSIFFILRYSISSRSSGVYFGLWNGT